MNKNNRYNEPSFIGINFCPECNNMLYPKEDKANRVLLYACRNCDYRHLADNPCVYVNKITHQADEMSLIEDDVISDPALPISREHPCVKCCNREAVFFQSQSRKAEEGMKLYFVCTNPSCIHKWTE